MFCPPPRRRIFSWNKRGNRINVLEKLKGLVSRFFQGFSSFIDGTVLTVRTKGNDKTVFTLVSWSRPVPPRRQNHLPSTRTVLSHLKHPFCCTLPARPVERIYRYRLVPSAKPTRTIPPRQCRHSFRSRRPEYYCTAVVLLPVKYVKGRQFRPVMDGRLEIYSSLPPFL